MDDKYLTRICGVCGKQFGWHQHTTDKCPANDKQDGLYLESYFINQKHMQDNYEYVVITEGLSHEVWGTGFYGEEGKQKAQNRIDEGYFHKHMYESDRHKKLIVTKRDGGN